MTFVVWLVRPLASFSTRTTTLKAEAADDLPRVIEAEEPGWQLVAAEPLRKRHDPQRNQ